MESQILIVAVAGWKGVAKVEAMAKSRERGSGEEPGWRRGCAQRKRKDRISYLRYETAGGEGGGVLGVEEGGRGTAAVPTMCDGNAWRWPRRTGIRGTRSRISFFSSFTSQARPRYK